MSYYLDVPHFTSRFINVNIPAPTDSGGYNFEFEFECQATATDLVLNGTTSVASNDVFFLKTTVVEYRRTGNTAINMTHGVNIANWNNYRFVFTGSGAGNIAFYVNGVFKANYTPSASIATPAFLALLQLSATTRIGKFRFFKFTDYNNSASNRMYDARAYVPGDLILRETANNQNGNFTDNSSAWGARPPAFISEGGDVTAPIFTVAPAASAIGQTSATVTATINETGSIFWVAVQQGDATPSVAQVIAGQNAAGAAPIDAGSAVGTTSLSEVASGFTAATDYKFCVVARDDETTPNVQSAVTVVNFTTASAGDTTPPVFTVAPAVTSVSQTTATVSATIDETGSIFWVVVPNAESTPSVSQVIAGQNAAGGTPTDSGSAVGTTTLSEGVAGMAASTAYKACFVARDDEGVPNVQATVTAVGFTTASVPVGTITIPDVVNNTDTPWTSAAVDAATVMPVGLGSVLVNKTGLSTTAGAELVITDAAIVTGTEYIIILKIGTAYGWYRAVAT